MSPPVPPGQAEEVAGKNASFFAANDRYADHVSELDSYRNVRAAIGPEIAGAKHLLDVGNGGVFDYDTGLAERIVGVDLFLDETSGQDLPPHVSLRRGDALALAEPDRTYDRVLEVSVFHHLIGEDVDASLANIATAVAEAHRVLVPGGRLVVMESCVSARAFAVERRLFGALRLLARTPLLDHPATLQFPPAAIASLIERHFGNVAHVPIPMGRWILQFGRRWPVALTPACHHLFTATRTG